jgi:plasmid stability protein
MSATVGPPKRRKVGIYLQPDVWAALRIAAIRRGTNASALVEGILTEWLEEQRREADYAAAEGKGSGR